MYKPKHPPVYTSCKLQYILFMSSVSQNESGEEGKIGGERVACVGGHVCACVCIKGSMA